MASDKHKVKKRSRNVHFDYIEAAPRPSATVERTAHHRKLSLTSRGQTIEDDVHTVTSQWRLPGDWAAPGQDNWELGLDDYSTPWEETISEPAPGPTLIAKGKRKRSQSSVDAVPLTK